MSAIDEGVELGDESLHFGEVFADHIGLESVLVEVGVEAVGEHEETMDFRVAGLSGEVSDGEEEAAVGMVVPASGLGGGLDHLGGGAPTLLGGLAEVSGLEFRAGLGEQVVARFAIGDGFGNGHGVILA